MDFAPTSFYTCGKKDVIRPLPCSSFPTATRWLAVGGPPCGRHFSPLRNIDFNRPFQKERHAFSVSFFLGFADRWPAPSVGILMLGGSGFRLRRGFACGKTLARRKSAAGQKAGWVILPYLFEILKYRFEPSLPCQSETRFAGFAFMCHLRTDLPSLRPTKYAPVVYACF